MIQLSKARVQNFGFLGKLGLTRRRESRATDKRVRFNFMSKLVNPVFKIISPLVLGVSVIAMAINPAMAGVAINDHLGTRISEIALTLEEGGFEIREIDVDRNRIEVDSIYEGKEWEIDIDRNTGRVIKIDID